MRTPFHAAVACCAAALSTAALLSTAAGNPVISEIMYRPGTGFPENTALEYIEIHNPTAAQVNLSGWALTSGVSFIFPAGSTVAAGGYLTIAADPAALNSAFGSVNALGPWLAGATLSNNGEKITLSQPGATTGTWATVDEVTYASEGDWAQRYIEVIWTSNPTWNGWAWTTPANGGGKSMELRNPALSNDNGQNWTASTAGPGGTPGSPNSVMTTNVPPVIHDVKHSPAVPRSTQSVTISCEVNDEIAAASRNATLFWRNATTASPPFSSAPMLNDGTGKFTAVLPPAADKAVIEFYVSSDDGAGTRTWPASTVALGQVANAQYQVDNEVSSTTADTYRLILTAAENAAYNSVAPSDRSSNKIDRQFNITLVTTRGQDHDIRYVSSIRFRGNSSRDDSIKPLRVSVPNDNSLDGVTDFNLNTRYPHLQHIGMRLFQAAGLAAPDTIPVEVRRNGTEYSSATRDYGKWVRMEDLNAGMADNHWPNANSGNLYKKGRPDRFWRSGASAPTNPDGLLDGWSKQNNGSANDWSDLTGFFSTWQSTAVPHFPGAPSTDVSNGTWAQTAFTPDEIETLETVADFAQWARWFAVMTIIQDIETNISNGQDDDYGVYFVPSSGRRRMQLLPHDLDTILGKGDNGQGPTAHGLYDMTEDGSSFRPLLPLIGNSSTPGNAAFRTSYHNAIRELCGTVFDTTTSAAPIPPFFAFIDNHLGDWLPAGQRTDIKNFMSARCAFLLTRIGDGPLIPPAATATSTLIQSHGALIISEVLAANTAAHVNGGLYPDVIELQNTGTATIDLSGKSLSDDPAQKTKFPFPASTLLGAGQFLLLYADSDLAAPGLHTGFQLDAGGDAVYLYDTPANGQAVLDSIVFGPQATDSSIGRTGANLNTWELCTPTIGDINAAVPGLGLGAPGSLRINEWLGNADFRLNDDFLEIFNPGTRPVPMGGMRLTDDFVNLPARHVLPPLSFIGPGGFHVFNAKGGDATAGNPSDLPFSIDSTFGWLALSGANGTIVDRASVSSQPRDQSTALSPDGSPVYATQTVPSPGLPNGSVPPAYLGLLNSLRITEFLYRPNGGNDYEFVELMNTGTTTLDLSGVRFTNGIDYIFPPGINLAPGAFIVVARNRAVLLSRFPTIGPVVAPGQYLGALDNNGERIALSLPNPWDVAILNFEYETSWVPSTFSGGYSLTVADATLSPRDWNERETWTASSVVNGTPGSDGPPAINSALAASGIKGDPLSYQISASRGPITFDATGLPPGLTVNTGNGLISGTPAQDGTFHISISAANAVGTGTATLVLTLAASGPLHRFTWDFTPPSAEAGVPFPALITARDAQGRAVTSWSGSATLAATAVSGGSDSSTVVITEVTDEGLDQFELQNTGSATVDTRNWFVVTGNSADIEAVSPAWKLPDSVAPGAILRVVESPPAPPAGALDFGGLIPWSAAFSRGWIMLCDSTSTPRDFFAWGLTAAELSALSLKVGQQTITTAGQWTGAGSPQGTRVANNNSWQRIGNSDRNTAADWAFATNATSFGLPNAGLDVPWPTINVVLLSPSSAAFSGGVFAGFIRTPSPATGVQITAENAQAQPGQSAPFDVVTAMTDADGDKMPDTWETANGLNPAVNDAEADIDQDGFSSLHEYYAGTDPQSATSVLRISSISEQPPSGLNLAWPVSPNRLYRVGTSTDLSNWTFVPGQSFAATAEGTQSTTFALPPGAAARSYYRIHLITPP